MSGGARRAEGRGDAPAARPSFHAYKLPRGRHALSREFVEENQRWRLIGAATEAFAERGYARITTHVVASVAGVSRDTFYRYFDDLESVLHTAFETVLTAAREAVHAGCQGEAETAARVGAGLEALASLLEAEPAFASFLGLEIAAVNADMAGRRELALTSFATDLAALGPGPGRRPSGAAALVLRARLAAAAALLAEPPGGAVEDRRAQLRRLLMAG